MNLKKKINKNWKIPNSDYRGGGVRKQWLCCGVIYSPYLFYHSVLSNKFDCLLYC